MKKILFTLFIFIILFSGASFSNPILTERYQEAQQLLKSMKLIEQHIQKIHSSPKKKYLTKRLWEYQQMLTDIKKRVKDILGLARFNFVDFNLHTIAKLRQHYYQMVQKIKGVHLLDSTQQIMQLLQYSIQEFLNLFSQVKNIKGDRLFRALEAKVFKKLIKLYGKERAKGKIKELHAAFEKIEKDIFNEVIEIVRFMTRFETPIKDFARQYQAMSSEERLVYVTANKEIIELIVQLEGYIEAHAIHLNDSKTGKPIVEMMVELIKKYYPRLLSYYSGITSGILGVTG